MKNTLRLKKQLRARRKKQSKRQTLSLEQLEPKQLLSANSDIQGKYDVYFSEYDQTYPIQLNDTPGPIVASYTAPWLLGNEDYQGYDNKYQWTAKQSRSETRASNEFTIDTIEEYYTYLSNGEVAEVSDKLVACFYQSNTNNDPNITPAGISTLYSGHQIENAWVGSSANLYDLLVLNQRFPRLLGPGGLPPTASARGGNGSLYGTGVPGNTNSSTLQPTPTFSGLVSDKALQGLTRIVGFPYGGGDGTFPNPIAATAGTIPSLAVFNHEDGIFTPASAKAGSTDHVYSIPDFVPTLRAFFQQTNDGRPLLSGSDSGRVRPLPHAVLEKLESWYAEGITQPKDPLKIFSEISGITHLGEIWSKYPPVYPGAPYDVYQHPVASPSIPIALQQTGANYAVYKEACEVVRGYYLDWKNNNNPPAQNEGGTPYTNEQAIEMFFNGFVEHRLVQLDAIDPVLDPVIYDSVINDLAVGLRALMAMSYDASPLWSSYGVGYSNAANPMVGKTYDEIAATSNPIEILSGQEFQLQNVQLPSNYLNVTGQNPVQTGPIGGQNSYPEYPSGGWFALQEPALPLNGINYISNIPDNDFTTNYTIGSTQTSVIFPSDSLSSNTLSAANLSSAGDLFTRDSIARDDLVGESTSQTFKELSGLTYHEDILEEGFSFATHISLAGGVDLVTGSPFSDVIVGPGHGVDDLPNKEFHGRLNVDAGAGDDIVAPGRGGSLVILGEGADKVVFGNSDLFGETNFLDFNFEQGDRLFIDHQITPEWNSQNPDTLVLKNATGDSKTLRLAGASDLYWNDNVTVQVGSSPTNAPGEFNYIETYSFYPVDGTTTGTELFNPSTWKNSGSNLVIVEKTPNTLPTAMQVSFGAGSQQIKQAPLSGKNSTYNGKNAIVIPLGSNSYFGKEISKWSDEEGEGQFKPLVFSLTPVTSNTAEQYQVFLSRQRGYLEDAQIKLVASELPNTMRKQWKPFKLPGNSGYTVGYMGGLANYIFENDLLASSMADNSSSTKVQLTINKPFSLNYGVVGLNAFNFSSRVSLFANPGNPFTTLAAAQDVCDKANYHQELPTNLGDLSNLSLLTNAQFIVNGMGQISGFNMLPEHKHLPVTSDGKPDPAYPEYWVDTDFIAISSTYQSKDNNDYAVKIKGITAEWPLKRGYGPVLLQDFNNVLIVKNNNGSAEISDWSSMPRVTMNQQGQFTQFYESPVRVYDYKQISGWIDRADGPSLGGFNASRKQGSKMSFSFIHTNDDSLKALAPYATYYHNTVLQGDAGNPIAFGYGFVNGGVGGTQITDTHIHRITHTSNKYGLVAMRVVPSPQYNRYNFIGVTVDGVQAWELLGPNNERLSSAMYGSVLSVGDPIRGFAPEPLFQIKSFDFQVGNVTTKNIYSNLSFEGGTSNAEFEGHYTPSTQPKYDPNTKQWTYPGNTIVTLDPDDPKLISHVSVTQNGVINLQPDINAGGSKSTIQRPKLRRSSKILVHRTGELEGKMGPSPVVLAYSTLADATLQGTRGSGRSNTFVVSKVASGYVEKKRSDGSWVDVSAPPKTSNPRTLLQLLRNRMITPSDEIRWVPGTANEGKASAKAFSLYGWDGVSASVEASEIEVGVE